MFFEDIRAGLIRTAQWIARGCIVAYRGFCGQGGRSVGPSIVRQRKSHAHMNEYTVKRAFFSSSSFKGMGYGSAELSKAGKLEEEKAVLSHGHVLIYLSTRRKKAGRDAGYRPFPSQYHGQAGRRWWRRHNGVERQGNGREGIWGKESG